MKRVGAGGGEGGGRTVRKWIKGRGRTWSGCDEEFVAFEFRNVSVGQLSYLKVRL